MVPICARTTQNNNDKFSNVMQNFESKHLDFLAQADAKCS